MDSCQLTFSPVVLDCVKRHLLASAGGLIWAFQPHLPLHESAQLAKPFCTLVGLDLLALKDLADIGAAHTLCVLPQERWQVAALGSQRHGPGPANPLLHIVCRCLPFRIFLFSKKVSHSAFA